MKNDELGSAKIIVSLENSIVTMEHGNTGEVLFTGKAQFGDWTKITNCIRSLKVEKNVPTKQIQNLI